MGSSPILYQQSSSIAFSRILLLIDVTAISGEEWSTLFVPSRLLKN